MNGNALIILQLDVCGKQRFVEMFQFNDLIQFPTGDGQRYSKRHGDYGTINVRQIKQLIKQPQSVPKDKAKWFIPSSYYGPWARNFEVQRQRGLFHMITADFDVGDLSIEWVIGSAEAVLGDVHMWVYSSASAAQDKRKWRLLVPLDEPLNGIDWEYAQNALFDVLEKEDAIADRALSRAAQLHFLPNVPPLKRDDEGKPIFYQSRIIIGGGYALS